MSTLPKSVSEGQGRIFLVIDGYNAGPYTVEQVEASLKAGQVSPTTMAWTPEATALKPLHAFPALSGVIGEPSGPRRPARQNLRIPRDRGGRSSRLARILLGVVLGLFLGIFLGVFLSQSR